MKHFCKIAEYTYSDAHRGKLKQGFSKPLLTTAITYKKTGSGDRVLAEHLEHRRLQNSDAFENARTAKFKPEYLVQSNSDDTGSRTDFDSPNSSQE